MDEISKIHVGLDVHKDSISVGIAEPGRAQGRVVGKTTHDVVKLTKLLSRLGTPEQLHLVYEAGPTGYGLQRTLLARGYTCEVIAPSLMPRRAGDRIKTDGRDCVQLSECSRAGQLRAVWIPQPADEAIRDLARAREDAVNGRTQARHQLKGFLLRHGLRYGGKTSWTKAYYAWLASLSFESQPAQTAMTEYCLAVQAADQRVQRLTQAVRDSIGGWRFEPVVKALQALCGVDVVTAVGLIAEIGDLRRFEHPRKLMGYLGLVPSEASSGDRVHRGSITKTGNAHARRLLTEAAWHYRFKARIGTHAQRRQQDLSQPIREIAERAGAFEQALCHVAGARSAGEQSLHRGGARVGRLRVGHRATKHDRLRRLAAPPVGRARVARATAKALTRRCHQQPKPLQEELPPLRSRR